MKSPFALNIVGGSVFSRYPRMSAETTYNMIVTGNNTKEPGLVSFAGYMVALDFIIGASRGVFLSTRLDEVVIVFGSAVYLININFNYRFLAELDSSTGDVYIAENASSQIGLVDGDRLYIYDYLINTFSQPTIYFRPVFIDFQDTYLIATFDNGSWGISASGNGHSWNALDQQQMQTKADKIVAAVVLNRQLWVIGNKAAELWADQGAELFPYVRDNSLSSDYGAANRATIDKGFGRLVWLAKNEKSGFSIMATDGGIPYPISDEGLDYKINQLSNPSDSTGFLFKLDGHIFYFINFLSDNFSIMFDFNSKLWFNMTSEYLDVAHIAKKCILFLGKLLFTSTVDSKFRQWATEIYDYDGKEIPRVRVCPNFSNPDDKTFILNKLNVQMEYGHTDSASKIQLSLSRDSGYSFGQTVSIDLPVLAHRKGKTTFRPRYRSNDVTCKFQFWSKGRFVVTNGIMEILHK
jgi:hypothetical protein